MYPISLYDSERYNPCCNILIRFERVSDIRRVHRANKQARLSENLHIAVASPHNFSILSINNPEPSLCICSRKTKYRIIYNFINLELPENHKVNLVKSTMKDQSILKYLGRYKCESGIRKSKFSQRPGFSKFTSQFLPNE